MIKFSKGNYYLLNDPKYLANKANYRPDKVDVDIEKIYWVPLKIKKWFFYYTWLIYILNNLDLFINFVF